MSMYLDNFLGQLSPGEAREPLTLLPGSPIVASKIMYCENRWKETKGKLLKAIQLSQDMQLQGAMKVKLYKAENKIQKHLVVVRANGFPEGKVLNTSQNESVSYSEKARSLFKVAKINFPNFDGNIWHYITFKKDREMSGLGYTAICVHENKRSSIGGCRV